MGRHDTRTVDSKLRPGQRLEAFGSRLHSPYHAPRGGGSRSAFLFAVVGGVPRRLLSIASIGPPQTLAKRNRLLGAGSQWRGALAEAAVSRERLVAGTAG